VATPRDIRRLAFQALFQFDARGEQDAQAVRAAVEALSEEDKATFSDREKEKAFELACGAYSGRREADEATRELAPTWPAHRQPAVDRAIIRLAYFEMVSGKTNPKIAVNEAVELAKKYSTDRSPAFVNAVLDKALRRFSAERVGAESAEPEAGELPVNGEGA
jgi:N utilization substance protein B